MEFYKVIIITLLAITLLVIVYFSFLVAISRPNSSSSPPPTGTIAPKNGQVNVWNATTSQWVPTDVADPPIVELEHSLGAHTDVETSVTDNAKDGDVLTKIASASTENAWQAALPKFVGSTWTANFGVIDTNTVSDGVAGVVDIDIIGEGDGTGMPDTQGFIGIHTIDYNGQDVGVSLTTYLFRQESTISLYHTNGTSINIVVLTLIDSLPAEYQTAVPKTYRKFKFLIKSGNLHDLKIAAAGERVSISLLVPSGVMFGA